MVNGDELANVGFQYIGVPYSQMDCQAFVEQCLANCGLKKDLAGSNAWFREVAKNGWVGTPEECKAVYGNVPAGAFLFILKHDGGEPSKYFPDGMGNASHIGICTGSRGEGAIHSSASRGMVCESKFQEKTIANGGWNMVGLWDMVDYKTPMPEPTPEPTPEPGTLTATVYAANGKPVNLRTSPNKMAALIDRVPCGDVVDVLERGQDWSKISWKRKKGFMMTGFLRFNGEPEALYCVTIHDLPQLLAEEIVGVYGGAITQERG